MVRFIKTLLLLLSTTTVFAQKYTCQDTKWNPNLKSSAIADIGNNSRSDTFDILNYSINLDLMQGAQKKIFASTTITFVPKINNQNSIRLDLFDLTVDSVIANGQNLVFTHQNQLLDINLPNTLNIGDTSNLEVFYNGFPKVDASNFGGFDFEGDYWYHLGVAFVYEPHNFGRGLFPCFDNFVERSTYKFTVKSPKKYISYGNGNLTSDQLIQDSIRIRTWETTTEFPTYLASVALAPYIEITDTFTSINGNKIPVVLACEKHDSLEILQSFVHLEHAFNAFEEKFGPYLWEKIGYSATPVGAMEHPGNIAYPFSLINGNLNGESIMAHELAHHWFGNLITCHEAQEMWINEGWAEYLSYYFEEAVYGKEKYNSIIKENHLNMLNSAHIQDGGYKILAEMPLNTTYGKHTYNKGADVIHTLRSYMGDSLFFEAHKNLLNQYKYSDITSEQFRDYLQNQGFTNANDYFDAFIFQKGWAQFDFSSWNRTNSGNTWQVDAEIVQNLREASNYYKNVPVNISYFDSLGNTETKKYTLYGQSSIIQETLSFKPVFAIINMDNKISLASLSYQNWYNSTGSKNYSDIDAKVKLNTITDSTFVSLQQNWVKPSGNYNTDRFIISPDRYYNLRTLNNSLSGNELELKYNGNNDLIRDFGLLQNISTNIYDEDRIVLLYRKNAQDNWSLYSDYTLKPGSNLWNKTGKIIAHNVVDGDYVLAVSKYPISVPTNQKTKNKWFITPNPSAGEIHLNANLKQIDSVSIYNTRGKKMDHFTKEKINKIISVSHLPNGIYWFTVTNSNGETESQKFLLKK